MVTVGDRMECPECSNVGRVVWVSKDGKTAGVQCSASHYMPNNPHPRFGAADTSKHRTIRNSVFLTAIK